MATDDFAVSVIRREARGERITKTYSADIETINVSPVPREDTVRVLVADPHSLFRDALRAVLAEQDHLQVVAEARDGMQAIMEAERTRPDVAIINAHLPNCDGIRATQAIAERLPNCQILVLSNEEDERALVSAMEAGATGYLSKESPLSELIAAATAMNHGEAVVPPRMLRGLLAMLIRRRHEEDEALRRTSRLTRREKEVLALLAKGADNDAIAQVLVISPQTARTHIQNVLTKLGMHSRLEAAAFVMQHGMLPELAAADA